MRRNIIRFTLLLPLLFALMALATEPTPSGFVTIFDGTSWNDWDHPSHLDGVWEISDGVIRLRTDQPKREKDKDYNLSTIQRYKDFTLMIDWRLTGEPRIKPMRWIAEDGTYHTDAAGNSIMRDQLGWGDSGIFLRGSPAAQVSIWCHPCGSGEVGTKFKDLEATREERMKTMPKVRADKGPNEWNRFVITVKSDLVEVKLNDVLVVEDARVKLIPKEGPITLQNHRDAVEFRNVFIKELSP